MHCPYCGINIPDTSFICPSCGRKTGFTYVDPNQKTSTSETIDSKSKVLAALSYLGILILAPAIAGKNASNPKFVRLHLKQGIVLLIATFVYNMIYRIITGFCDDGTLLFVSVVGSIGSIALCVIQIIGIINAAKGRYKELPIIGSLFKESKNN